MIRVGISGAMGRMGKTIAQLSLQDPEIQILGALERKTHPAIGKDYGNEIGITLSNIIIESEPSHFMSNIDVMIDFSIPENTIELANICKQYSKAMVIGTTGLSQKQQQIIKQISEDIPILLAPNMSLGVNVLFYLVQEAATLLKDQFQVEIMEIHHSRKKDSPSGTAVRLKEIIQKQYQLSEDSVIYGRKGIIGERPEKEIGVHALRGGDVVGEHTIYFFSNGERIEISHKATSREIFAKGAITAVKWIYKKDAGMYSMNHVLGIQKI